MTPLHIHYLWILYRKSLCLPTHSCNLFRIALLHISLLLVSKLPSKKLWFTFLEGCRRTEERGQRSDMDQYFSLNMKTQDWVVKKMPSRSVFL